MNYRNGYREHRHDRAGDLEAASGQLFPGLAARAAPPGRAGADLGRGHVDLPGVSTRRVEKLAGTLGITSLSKSQVSELAKSLDAAVEQFRSRPLDAGAYRFVQTDAMTVRVCKGGRTVLVHALIATGVNFDGKREIFGLDVTSAEDGAGWLPVAFLGHAGHLRCPPGPGRRDHGHAAGSTWQRCRTHYRQDLLTKVSKTSQPRVAALMRTIFDQPDAAEVCAQCARVADALQAKLPAAVQHLSAARDDLLAFTAVPREIWRQVWSSNPQERQTRPSLAA